MDTIIIQDLEIFYRVGVPEAERATPQRLLVTLELVLDLSTAALKDEVRWTIDYDDLCRRLMDYGERRDWVLIETVAVDVADLVMKEYTPMAVVVEVKKFVLPQTRYVSVRVSRPQ